MSTYFIGDIHGCYKEFKLLLKQSSFNYKKDFLWISGDLVSRGPNSLEVLKYIYSIQDKVKIVLGNHDLNLIAVYLGVKKNNKEHQLDAILSSKDSLQLINWLRCQSVLKVDEKRKIIMSHAGISPQLDLVFLKTHALEINKFLSSDNCNLFLEAMYNNDVYFWNNGLNKLDQLRYILNTFTRMRYCYPDGKLNMFYKKSPHFVKDPLKPWFMIENKISKKYSIFFGHWSSLKGTFVPFPFFPLDTGCCWGGELSMLRWEDKKWFSQPYLL